jgi:hypothetical protein
MRAGRLQARPKRTSHDHSAVFRSPDNRWGCCAVETVWRKPVVPEVGLNSSHVLKFQSLSNAGKALVFPCDAQGRVALDALSDRARENYLYARAVVGREFAYPRVLLDTPH